MPSNPIYTSKDKAAKRSQYMGFTQSVLIVNKLAQITYSGFTKFDGNLLKSLKAYLDKYIKTLTDHRY